MQGCVCKHIINIWIHPFPSEVTNLVCSSYLGKGYSQIDAAANISLQLVRLEENNSSSVVIGYSFYPL